jgi:hypothetical protein
LIFDFTRVEEYIKAGRDKNIVDPDPNKIYTRRKEKQNSSQGTGEHPPIKYPTNGWSTKLERMPLFTRAEMNLHVSQSGKNIASVSKNHSVPTSMRKAKTFLEDEYLKDVLAASDNNYFYFKAFCYHSYRKNDDPHNLKLGLCLLTGNVQHAFCSCVAGSVGFCNHILGLMMKLCKLSLYDCKDIKELNHEEDMSAPVACRHHHNKCGTKLVGALTFIQSPLWKLMLRKQSWTITFPMSQVSNVFFLKLENTQSKIQPRKCNSRVVYEQSILTWD